ncbi:hypothetical protein D3C86_2228180 [compost metagenome]
MVTSWYLARYIEIFCGPKWYCCRNHRIDSTTSRSVFVGWWCGALERSFSPSNPSASYRRFQL